MLRPNVKRPGWFFAEGPAYAGLTWIPGASQQPQGLAIHRTHLPLVDAPEAFEHRTRVDSSTERWQARDALTKPLGVTLRTTQQQAIDFITARRGTLLGDDMRLGKSLSAICSHDPRDGKLIVIAPLMTRGHWLAWLRRMFPGQTIGLMLGKTFKPEALEHPIVFAHYDVISAWQAILPIATLVLDEAHMLTNPEARRTLAAAALGIRAARVIALTGTPVWRLPPDLWSILNLIEPGAWGNYNAFANRYGAPVSTAYGTKYTGISYEDELNARLSEVMLRRRWVDVSEDVPAISRSVVIADITPAEQRKLDILAASIQGERGNTMAHLASYRRVSFGFKVSTITAEATKRIKAGEPVVVWTWHRDSASALAERMDGTLGKPKAYVIHGEIGAAERDTIIEQWRTHLTGPAVLVATMAVAQVGIDLSHARFAIFAEIDYTPAILGQAEMRTFAPTRPMDVTFVIANHLVDQRIVRALVAKLSAASPIGVGAATEAIDALREAVMGPTEDGDLDRLLENLIASQG